MPYTCCVPNCDSGYRSCKSQEKYSMFKFPKDVDVRNKWLAAIPRKNWTVTNFSRVCSKHFDKKDFKESSTDKKAKRRQSRKSLQLLRLSLQPCAIPHIFPGLHNRYNIKTPMPRSGSALSSSRLEKENEQIRQQYDEFCCEDKIASLDELKKKLNNLCLPVGCCSLIQSQSITIHCFKSEEISNAPKLLFSLIICDNLSVVVFKQSLKVNNKHFQHLLDHGCLKTATALLNIIAHCKMLCNDDSGSEQNQFLLELAIASLQKYIATSFDLELDISSKLQLVKFLISQLQLLQVGKHARRYSTDVITTAFLWQLTSCTLYKKLRELFILPSISRLRCYSSCLSVSANSLDTSYLLQRTEHLSEKERMVTLMIDEIYTAKRIEYSNGSFVGLTEEGEPAKTVLAFMVQSVCSKFKDIVCLVPVHNLDSTQLRLFFDKVMQGLKDILFVVAVSVDNHVCNRKMFVDLCGGKLKPCISHPTKDGEFLFLIFDFTHNFKNIFNNFLSKNRMNVPTFGFETILDSPCLGLFADIKHLYALEEHKTLKIAHSLKKASLNPSNVAKTSPQHAICVFSEPTAYALQYYSTTHASFAGTGNFVTFINKLWKIMSLKSPSKGFRKNDIFCNPLSINEDGQRSFALHFLEQSVAIFKNWKESGLTGLTAETFTACIQSMEAMVALTCHLVSKHGFKYVLPGKFTSDPIEGRFGWYRQVSGGNFYISILQLFQAEKKIRCLSLLQNKALLTLSTLNFNQPVANNCSASNKEPEDISWLKSWATELKICEIDEDDASVTYYVAGYVGRSISRRRKCSSCRNMLVERDYLPSSIVSDNRDALVAMADRGGLSAPKQYCFAICAFGVQIYKAISGNDGVRKQFLCLKNQQTVFVSLLVELATESSEHVILTQQECEEGHCNFSLILQSLFNCFAKNELKRINRCEIEDPAKMSRGLRKLSSKSTPKQ